ncbi:hypothetical protein EMIT0210MI2_14091 [Priestia megaterium]
MANIKKKFHLLYNNFLALSFYKWKHSFTDDNTYENICHLVLI